MLLQSSLIIISFAAQIPLIFSSSQPWRGRGRWGWADELHQDLKRDSCCSFLKEPGPRLLSTLPPRICNQCSWWNEHLLLVEAKLYPQENLSYQTDRQTDSERARESTSISKRDTTSRFREYSCWGQQWLVSQGMNLVRLEPFYQREPNSQW